jgi:hypothetical protein
VAFPTIPTSGAGRVLTANQLDSTATRTFPNLSGLTKNSGDLLIAIVVGYQSSATANAVWSSWSAGWTEFLDYSTTTGMCIGAAYKWSTGSETGTISVTQAATITGDASMILLSIAGAHATTPPEGGSGAQGTTSAADPAAFNPSGWDVEDTLWISVLGSGLTNISGAWAGTGASGPTNFTGLVRTNATDTSVIGDCEAAVSFRQNATASQDVGTAGVDTSNARNAAAVIAVRPAPTPLVSTLTDEFTSLDTAKWTMVTGGTVSGGYLTLATTSGWTGAVSTNFWSLVGSSMFVELAQTGATAASQTHFYVDAGGNSDIRFQKIGTTLYASYKVTGTETFPASTTYSATDHRWLRISESGGTITWATSADGNSWTTFNTWTLAGFTVSDIKPTFYSGYDGVGAQPADSLFDNFNVAAAPPTLSAFPVTRRPRIGALLDL